MTIKLSLFMLDPMKAHEKYMKEIEELNAKIAKEIQSHKELKKQYGLLRKKLKNQRATINIVESKLHEERKANEIWSN